MSQESGKSIVDTTGSTAVQESSFVGKNLDLRSGSVIDLSGLNDQQVAELREQHARGMIDIKKKAEEMQVDAAALQHVLGGLNEHAARATQEGTSITATHTQSSSLGRTEIVVGNT